MASASSPLRQVQPIGFSVDQDDEWADMSDEEIAELDVLFDQADADLKAGLLEPYTCFSGTPMTQSDLLNACTDAEQIDRLTHVPKALWDGTSPLTPLP